MSKDKYSVHWDGSESDADDSKLAAPNSSSKETGLPDHMLDSHHETLMKAEAIKNNPHIMKHLRPHMENKMAEMKKVAGLNDEKPAGKKHMSLDDMKAKAKTL